jgi:hypothetical protein
MTADFGAATMQSMRGWRLLKVTKTAGVQFGVVMTTTD